jgi:hypothetical protein
MADPLPDIIAPGVLVVDPVAADVVVVAAAELLPVLVVPPQAARVRVRAAVSAAAPDRANMFIRCVLL